MNLRTITLAAALGTSTLAAAPPDFSALDQKPEVTKPALPAGTPGATRGLTRGLASATPRAATRGYDATRGKVTIEAADGSRKELPYVVLPILFEKDSAKLLGQQSEDNLRLLAAKLQEPQFAGARFVVEGHTSTEGDTAYNFALSERRAERIFARLITDFQVEAARLSRRGFGEQFPEVEERVEADRERNRRVLVVREE